MSSSMTAVGPSRGESAIANLNATEEKEEG